MPTSPQAPAGMRIAPSPSLPCATGTIAEAAADPPATRPANGADPMDYGRSRKHCP